MAKKIEVSERDAKAAAEALEAMEKEETGGLVQNVRIAFRLSVRLHDLKPLLKKVAGPRVSKPLRPH